MDNSSSERSPSYTDSSPGSFGQMKFWESDVSTSSTSQRHKPTYPLFGLDHVKEIEGLVEDKDVASKAVTFVVNGTRKGVVRLCADVACLMRVKKRLEQTVEKQRRELQHLHSLHNLRVSTRTSRSTSPTLPTVDSCETNLPKITADQSLCSRCSPASSYVSSPPLSFEQSLASLQSKEDSQQTEGTNCNVLYDHQHVIKAEVHPVPGDTAETEKEMDHVTTDSHSLDDNEDDLDDDDDDSDPVTIVEHGDLQPLRADCKLQTKLEEDLETARKEIQKLRLQLIPSPEKEHENSKQSEIADEISHKMAEEMSHKIAHEMSHKMAHEIACEMACEMNVIDETRTSFSSESSLVSLPQIKTSSQSNLVLVTQTSSDLQHSCNCHCAKCTENEEEERGHTQTKCSTFALEHRSKRCKGHSVPVQLNDRVVIRGGRIGHIRYIGPLNHGNSNMKNTVYLGIQLEEPHGNHDGIHNGKRYFWCHRNHGIFIPIQDVLSVVKAKTSRPQTVRSQRSTDSSSKTSTDNKKEKEKSGNRNRVGPALLPTPPTTAKPKREFLAST